MTSRLVDRKLKRIHMLCLGTKDAGLCALSMNNAYLEISSLQRYLRTQLNSRIYKITIPSRTRKRKTQETTNQVNTLVNTHAGL